MPLVVVLKTQGRAYSTHESSNAAVSTTPRFPSSSSTNPHRSTLYPHSPLLNTPMVSTVFASVPPYPSALPLSPPSSLPFLLRHLGYPMWDFPLFRMGLGKSQSSQWPMGCPPDYNGSWDFPILDLGPGISHYSYSEIGTSQLLLFVLGYPNSLTRDIPVLTPSWDIPAQMIFSFWDIPQNYHCWDIPTP
ncbi:hypothetical protein K435DRAFT_858267 [Dendrothele bispora CBS 962.96]|uniref:Uncharacterized protein n=1 Tax=Dendrothele bispora (strain CBS 962.96) TaxID=1314807 RepID=A0A4V6T5F8_DENBC|nr:hypothetical protein K435DRAFT_858267 [Dendrothele bispora CBS 962.96]